jgi:hypothetical protein
VKVLGSSVATRNGGLLDPIAPSDGKNGASAWTPMLAIEADGTARYLKVVDWSGGTGTKPEVGYVGTTEITTKAKAPNLNAAKRVAFFSGVSITNGIASITFTGYTAPPSVAVVSATPAVLLGAVKAELVAGSVTKDGCQVKVTTASLAGIVSALLGATVTVLTIEA